MSTAWTKGDRKARRQLEKALKSDETDNVTRFALVRLLANKAEPVAAEELLRVPGIEDKMLADPTTRVDILTSLGGAYLMLWRARGATTSGNNRSGGNGQGRDTTLGVVEIRLDVSSDRMDLLHRAQHFLQEALTAPEKMNDPALRAQVAFCKEARGDCKEALALYASIISDSALSPGISNVIFRTSVLLAYVGRLDECVRYLEFIEGQPPKGCSTLLVQALLYTCFVSMGLEMKASRRLETVREAFNEEYTAGRMGVGFSRDEIPWDRLPGWFHMWRELGVHSLRGGDYYAGIQMFSQATLQREDAETMVCTGEMLWVLGDAKRALTLCERAYAADPLHTGAKKRLSGWAPEKWKERIAKEEERREAVAEMRRLADLSGRKADAMLARRGRREKARLLRAWRRLHDKRKNCRRRKPEGRGGEEEGEGARRGGRRRGGRTATSSPSTERGGSSGSSSSSSSSGGSGEASGSGSSSDSGTSSSSGSTGSSRSAASGTSDGDRSSSFASSLSTKGRLEHSVGEGSSLSSSSAPPPRPFPASSAADAADAGRANFAACLRAETERADALGGRKATANMAPLEIAAAAVCDAMHGTGTSKGGVVGTPGFTTQEMRALARFKSHRKIHEAEITRIVYGSGS